MSETMTRPVIATGYDGSPAGAAALDWATLEASRTGAIVRSISVVHYPGMPAGTPGSAPILPASLLNRAHELSAEASSRAGNVLDPDSVETQIVIGAAAEALVSATQSVGLLVVGNRGRSELAASVLGSVSFAVTAHAHCPVVVVSEHAAPVGPEYGVVVGVDLSPAGERALDLAADLAAGAGASLRIICAWDLPTADTWAFAYWETASPDADWAHTQHAVAARVVAAAVDRVRTQRSGLVLTGDVLQGQPGAVLGRASRTAGLVVVGSRGLGGFSGLVLGSVSHHVIHSCACPVMVVRTRPSERIVSAPERISPTPAPQEDVMAGSRPVTWWNPEREGRPDDDPHIPP